MTLTVNYLIIVALFIAIAFFVYTVSKKSKQTAITDADIEETETPTIEGMVDDFARAVSKTLRTNPAEMNLSRDELERQQELLAQTRDDFDKAEDGDPDARARVKELCFAFITKEYAVNTHEEIDKIISFSKPEYLTSNDKMEIMYHMYKKCLKDTKDKMFADAMQGLIVDNDFDEGITNEKDGMTYYVIDTKRMDKAYERVMINHESPIVGNEKLTLRDKQDIIVHRIVSLYKGWNIIDIFYESAVDEIMAGTSGIPAGTYRIPKAYANAPMSYEGIWTVFRGSKLDFECLSFGSHEEFKRVVDNIAKFEAKYVLSKAQPGLQGTMEDGSRIVVARNPFGTAEAFWLRKFDTARAASLHWLYGTSKYDVLPIVFIKWLIMAECNGFITGGMGTGKTTALRTGPRYMEPKYSIRTYEKSFELNLNYTYPQGRNIYGFQETEMFSEQDGIDFGKKTMGDITIVGEIARAYQTVFFLQTCNVASRQGLATHHANTLYALVDALSDDLQREGVYADKEDAIRAVIRVLNFDIHLDNTGTKGNRHIERISIVVPLAEKAFPSDYEENKNNTPLENAALDASHYMKEQIRKQLFTSRDLVVWKADDELENTGHYELKDEFTEELLRTMVANLNEKRRQEFDYDMMMAKRANDVFNNNNEKAYSENEIKELLDWQERIIA